MRVLFIRHADAEPAAAWPGKDGERPLTRKGHKVMKAVARCLARRFDRPDVLVSSPAVRARESAEILCAAFGGIGVEVEESLAPGATVQAYLRRLSRSWDRGDALVVMVGHEPELSALVSQLVAEGRLALKFKKSACAEVELSGPQAGLLRALLDPALL